MAGKTTGRASRVIADRRGLLAESEDAFSIKEFCTRHGISESFYFKLKQQGLGPREMHLGSRRLVSREAAREWREKVSQTNT
jgi:hypothetical protein